MEILISRKKAVRKFNKALSFATAIFFTSNYFLSIAPLVFSVNSQGIGGDSIDATILEAGADDAVDNQDTTITITENTEKESLDLQQTLLKTDIEKRKLDISDLQKDICDLSLSESESITQDIVNFLGVIKRHKDSIKSLEKQLDNPCFMLVM